MRDTKVYQKFVKDVPENIFKYSSIDDNLKRSLRESYLWLSKPADFNDPFDCNLNLVDFTTTKKDIWKITSEIKTGNRKQRRKNISKGYKNRLKAASFYRKNYTKSMENWGVCCFSRDYDNILMWSHYARKHTGICLSFDPRVSTITLTIGDIIYVVDHTPVNYFKEEEDSLIRMILMKSKVWEYENEIRIFKDFNGPLPIPKQSLKEIIFGCNALPDDIEEIKNIVTSTGYNNIKFRKAVKNANSFLLDFEEIG